MSLCLLTLHHSSGWGKCRRKERAWFLSHSLRQHERFFPSLNNRSNGEKSEPLHQDRTLLGFVSLSYNMTRNTLEARRQALSARRSFRDDIGRGRLGVGKQSDSDGDVVFVETKGVEVHTSVDVFSFAQGKGDFVQVKQRDRLFL